MSLLGNRPVMPLMTRDKTGTSRDKTGTSRDKIGTSRNTKGQQGQNRDSRDKHGQQRMGIRTILLFSNIGSSKV